MELVMGPLPAGPKADLQLKVHTEQAEDGYRIRLVSYQAEVGDRAPAYVLLPARTKSRLPAVVCLHQTTAIGKSEPAGLGGKPNLHYAADLARLGFVTIAPDYPGFGDYKFDSYAHGYLSATMKGIVNHMRAVDLLQALPEADPRRIGAIGHSLGGHNALFLAAFDERIRAVVTSCGFTSFRRYMGGDLTGWSHRGYMPRIASEYGKSPEQMPFDFSDVLEAIAPRPVFVNAPLNDSNFDATGVDEAVQQAEHAGGARSSGRITVRHPAAGHDFPADIRKEAYGFLSRSLS
ncbi:MAG TPA: alpha/beta fold hydrolase [Bryobacteraceae bacterium]|nr:alpha/beta fold hydrolase [Bryobacteraceae bacterium]